MRQSAFTIMTPVRAGRAEALAEHLRGVGDSVPSDPLGLSQSEGLHYCSFSLVEADTGSMALLFEGNIDGRPATFLEGLARRSQAALDDIYEHCTGYPVGCTDPSGIVRFLCDHDIGATTFYVAWPGLTVEQVRRDAELRRTLQDLIDSGGAAADPDPSAVRRALLEELGRRPEAAWALARRAGPNWTRIRSIVAVGAQAAVLLAGIGIVVPFVALAAIRLRIAERMDDELDRERDWESEYAAWSQHLQTVRRREDVRGQNHLASIVQIKSGLFRRLLLRAVLAVVAAGAAVGPPGSLAGITSIHFARWTVTADRRLIFLSNFDGSWESYLGDFIDIAAGGLTAVWTNTENDVGFPSTRWLVDHGARDEARFKAFARRGMVQTLVWYSAYPDLSVANISNNVEIRRGVVGAMNSDEAQTWLRRL